MLRYPRQRFCRLSYNTPFHGWRATEQEKVAQIPCPNYTGTKHKIGNYSHKLAKMPQAFDATPLLGSTKLNKAELVKEREGKEKKQYKHKDFRSNVSSH